MRKDSNPYNFKNYSADHDKIFTGGTHHEWGFVGGPMAHPTQTNPRWRWPPSLIFEKISITPDWIKISAPNLMGRRNKAMHRWPRDQMKVWSICASISVTITDIWTKFGTEHKYHTTNTRMRMLFRGWPIMVNDTHTRRRRRLRQYISIKFIVCHHWHMAVKRGH